jgi:hypothetical protein
LKGGLKTKMKNNILTQEEIEDMTQEEKADNIYKIFSFLDDDIIKEVMKKLKLEYLY